jgi:hypothetical protein
MNDNNDFDHFLNKRQVPAASSNLSRRIVSAAVEKRNNLPFYYRMMDEIMMMLYVPKPAYAFAFVLVLGIFIGLQMNVDETLTSSDDLFSFTQIEQEEWL